jgi:hypothetical protein
VEKGQEEPHFCGWVCNAEIPDPKAAFLPKKRAKKRTHPQVQVLPPFPVESVKNKFPETRETRFLGGSISQNLNLN